MMYYRLAVAIAAGSAIIPTLLFLLKFRPPRQYRDVALGQRLLVLAILMLSINTCINYTIAFIHSDTPPPELIRIIITCVLVTVGVGAAWTHFIVYLRRR